MSTAIAIPNDMPAPSLEIVPAPLVSRHEALLSTVASLPAITCHESAAHAEVVLCELAEIERGIEAAVEYRSKPAFQLHKAIVAVGKKALEPIAAAKATLRGKIGIWNREQDRLRQEAIAKAEAERRAAEAAAEKERQRLQAIADAEHAAKVMAAEVERAKLQAEADAKAAAEQAEQEREAKELAEMLGTVPEIVNVEAPKVVVEVAAAPVVKVDVVASVAVVPPPVKSSVITRKVPKLFIDNADLIPAFVGGRLLRDVNQTAVRQAIMDGVVVPGAHVEMVDSDVMRSVR